MESKRWDVNQYSKFINERTRPALELLSRINLDQASEIYDLGCGPGNSTEILKNRWANAKVIGVDSSKTMLAEAQKHYPSIEFIQQDINLWQPNAPADLIFSNAAYQWVLDHQKLLPRLIQYLKPGGVLAMQMPNNYHMPTHSCMKEVAVEYKWSVDLTSVRQINPVLTAQVYYDLICQHMRDIDIWQTVYFHVMDSIDAIVEWLKGTGLKPFIDPLTNDECQEFCKRYTDKLKMHFKPQANNKVLLPFPRLFVVAYRC